MNKINSFGIIGGDKRQLEVAKSIAKDGYTVVCSGLENISLTSIPCVSVERATQCEAIILPLPVTKDFETINAPFSATKILLNNIFIEHLQNKPVFCGMKENFLKAGIQLNPTLIYDYFDREEFLISNAVPTAEGAIEIALREYTGTINGARCLVTGFGRIGKVLASILKGMNAKTAVSARKKEDLAWIQLQGYTPIDNKDLTAKGSYDIIFNTVPFMVLNARTLAHIAQSAIVIDLASVPGGVDFESAKRLNIKTIHALSLPGKVAPKTAGEIIKNTIYNIIEEDDT